MKFRLCLLALFVLTTALRATRTLTINNPVRRVSLFPEGTSVLVDPGIYLNSDGGIVQTVICKLGGFKSGDLIAVTTANASPNLSSTYTQSYDSVTGVLSITDPTPTSGEGASGATWEALLRTLRFYPATGNLPQNNVRTVEYEVLESGSYYAHPDGTYHFYDFISSAGIAWPDAKSAAVSQLWYGKVGYLGTITSSAEFTFMAGQAPGTSGWLAGCDSMSGSLGGTDGGTYASSAATDTLSEGYWKWDAGPEAGQLFWTANTHAAGTHSDKTGTTALGRYSNWPSNQPDNSGEEDALQITSAGAFNDLPVAYGSVDGYFVEWGGMSELATVVTIKIQNHNAIKHAAGF